MALKKNRFIFVITLLGFLLIPFFVASAVKVERKTKDDTYKELGIFSDSLMMIQNQYVGETKPKDLVYGALKGMLSSLDPYSEFLSPEEYKELQEETEGKFGGVGMEVTMRDSLLTVVSPIEDTPAWKAGIKTGDRIVKIDDKIIKDFSLTDAVKLLRGNPGTEVKITIWRQKEKKMLDFKIIRALIKIEDIKEKTIIDSNIGYIKLSEFSEKTPEDFSLALKELKEKNMSALILDLRNNPGGLLEVAVKVAESFLGKGKMVVSTKGRNGIQDLKFISSLDSEFKDIPLVVLINEGSASGSEIVAGALQDYKRAIIMGEKSFGKGSVQTVLPLSDGSALKLTTSKYYTPLERQISEKGIPPDIEVKFVEASNKEEDNSSKIPLEIIDTFNGTQEKTEENSKNKYKDDNQLLSAIDVLKGLLIYSNNKITKQ